ncbi:MAG: universal stress protein [Thermodesulfovibrionales bacterium]|nr:universal stress protein [Thermodesulfovibrionales bacterium]
MITKILYPTKFDEFSLPILKSLVCLKATGLKEVVLLHVIDEDAIYLAKESGLPVDLKKVKKSAELRLQEYTEYLKSEGLQSKTKISSGNVVNEIIKESNNDNISLIVTGRHKRHLIDELFIGSTTDGIVKKSSLPVLIIKYHSIRMIEGKSSEHFCQNIFRKVLYATDWSGHSEKAKPYLTFLYSAGAREIVVVNVLENGSEEDDSHKMNSLKDYCEAIGFKVTYHITHGKPYNEIIRVAGEEDTSLILMGSHGKGFIKGILIGSVSQRVIEYSDRSVFIIK